MLRIENLRKSYGSLEVLKGINMSIAKGDVYGFLGKNGCGKTTTMNILCNIIKKDSGEIIFDGEEENKSLKIGYLPETPALYGYMNSEEYLEYIAACCNYQGDVKHRIAEVIDTVGMTGRAKRAIKTYSRGMNQRAGIAAAIFNHPDLLVLDEPTSALDPQGRSEVMDIITRLADEGCTIILCTHILPDVERVANRIGIMRNGVMMLEDSIGNIVENNTANGVELKISDPNPQKMNIIKNIDFAKGVEFNERNGRFNVYADNAEECAAQLLQLLAANNIVPENFNILKTSLEEIYIKAVS